MKESQFGKLYIKKRTFSEWVTLYIFVMPFFLSFFLDLLSFPSVVKYTIDAAWFAAMILLVCTKYLQIDRKMTSFIVFIVIFFLYTLVVHLFNYQTFIYYLWGFRNNFRFYFAFILFAVYIDEHDAQLCFKLLDFLFYVNAVVSFFQFFVLGFQWDYLGGIFGTERGCNGYFLVFFSLIIGRSLLLYMEEKESIWLCLLKCTLSLVLSAMAEIKVFFVIFVIILLMSLFLTKFNWKKFLIVFFAGLLFALASTLVTQLFGESSSISVENILEQFFSQHYGTQEDLGRFTAIPIISNRIFTNISQRLFGLGLGNCDTSSFAICNTPFFETYGDMHYNWFSSAFLFLETGSVGLVLYLCFFLMSFFTSLRLLRKNLANRLYCQLSMIVSVLCFLLTFYNSSLRYEVAYMVYFALAMPLASARHRTQSQDSTVDLQF